MMKRTLIVLALAGAAVAASAYAATHLERIGCLLERSADAAQEIVESRPVQLARSHAVTPVESGEELEDEHGRYYDERDLPFKPQRF